MIVDIILFELFLFWSYLFFLIKNSFSDMNNVIFKIFISNISILTFIITIIMGLMKFDLFFVLLSVSIVMFSINFIYDHVKKKYYFYSKKYYFVDKIKPMLDFIFIAFISFNIYY